MTDLTDGDILELEITAPVLSAADREVLQRHRNELGRIFLSTPEDRAVLTLLDRLLGSGQAWRVTEKRIDALDIAASELEDTVPSVAATLRAMVAETE